MSRPQVLPQLSRGGRSGWWDVRLPKDGVAGICFSYPLVNMGISMVNGDE